MPCSLPTTWSVRIEGNARAIAVDQIQGVVRIYSIEHNDQEDETVVSVKAQQGRDALSFAHHFFDHAPKKNGKGKMAAKGKRAKRMAVANPLWVANMDDDDVSSDDASRANVVSERTKNV